MLKIMYCFLDRSLDRNILLLEIVRSPQHSFHSITSSNTGICIVKKDSRALSCEINLYNIANKPQMNSKSFFTTFKELEECGLSESPWPGLDIF